MRTAAEAIAACGRGRRARETDDMERAGQVVDAAMWRTRGERERDVRDCCWWSSGGRGSGGQKGLRLGVGASGGEAAVLLVVVASRTEVGARKSGCAGRATHRGRLGRGAPVDQVAPSLLAPLLRRRAADTPGPQEECGRRLGLSSDGITGMLDPKEIPKVPGPAGAGRQLGWAGPGRTVTGSA